MSAPDVTPPSAHAGLQSHRGRAVYATKPTGFTRFMRTFLPWQMLRFAIINLKMMGIIWRSHK
ncbi:unnamed protein product [Laminaria digitata]